MSRVKESVNCFKEGFNCSQAICSTYAPDLGLDRETALRISAAFGGGIARKAETCGTVTGALMLIGLKLGNVNAEDKQRKGATLALSQEFLNRFIQDNGSTQCKDLLGCDISTAEGSEIAKQKELFTTLCPKIVENAASLVEELLFP